MLLCIFRGIAPSSARRAGTSLFFAASFLRCGLPVSGTQVLSRLVFEAPPAIVAKIHCHVVDVWQEHIDRWHAQFLAPLPRFRILGKRPPPAWYVAPPPRVEAKSHVLNARLRLLIVTAVTLLLQSTLGCWPSLDRINCNTEANSCIGNSLIAGSVLLVAGTKPPASLVFSASPAWDWVDLSSR